MLQPYPLTAGCEKTEQGNDQRYLVLRYSCSGVEIETTENVEERRLGGFAGAAGADQR